MTNELRIGNYISFINRSNEVHIPQTHPLTVMDISFFKVETCQIDENFAMVKKPIVLDSNDICGIELTEEWLLKVGFEKKDIIHNDGSVSKDVYKNYPVLIKDNRLYEDKGKYAASRFIPGKINETTYLTQIDYLHHLQNLYFALTQTELTIK